MMGGEHTPRHPAGQCGQCDQRRTTHHRSEREARARRHAAAIAHLLDRATPDPAADDRDPWQERAACIGVFERAGDDPFFPLHTAGPLRAVVLARRFCDGCPVRRQCARFAADNAVEDGVWAGVFVGWVTTNSASRHTALARLRAIADSRDRETA